ncbi:MAG: biotin transporter BioY, partial [Clostridia bacterium]|nr:biotin transporter BioY [Clostridia bacterium]
MRNTMVKNMVVCALFAAIICICAPISIPIGPVSITLAIFAVALAAVVLGAKWGTAATALYILIGAVGLPVFSGFKGGLSVLVGMTGGYITSYIFVALLIGAAECKRINEKPKGVRIAARVIAAILALAVCYGLGTLQFVFVTKCEVGYALTVCVLPFIVPDAGKIVAAELLG